MSKGKILVAEDDASVRSALNRLINSMGYDVDLAQDYVGAAELIDTNAYKLIVCDNGMPLAGESRPNRTCGLQLLARAKHSRGINSKTPFILHTADDTEETKQTATKLGGIYLQKGGGPPIGSLIEHLLEEE